MQALFFCPYTRARILLLSWTHCDQAGGCSRLFSAWGVPPRSPVRWSLTGTMAGVTFSNSKAVPEKKGTPFQR